MPKLNRNLPPSRISQPVRAVSIKASAEDVEVTNNGAVGAAQASNMLDFEELSDIVRCAVRPAAAIMHFYKASGALGQIPCYEIARVQDTP